MAVRTRRRGATAVASALGIALALTACGGSSDEPEATGTAGSPAADGECAAFADYGTFDNVKVEIYNSIRDIEAERFDQSFTKFEECTGIDIQWNGTGEFEAQLKVRVEGNNAPDIAVIPQPGLLQTLVAQGAVKAPSEKVATASKENFSEDWLSYGTVDGTFYAPPLGGNVKSFVWYSPSMFSENGWTVPETWADLLKLTETIAASGKVDRPWCAGFESGDASGWPGTDWIEDIMLRTAGPEGYDQWYKHEIPFNDPKVVAAFDEAGKVLKNEKYVNGGLGGVDSIATTSFQAGGAPIVESGDCALHRQASFYANQWPEGTTVGEDGDVFAFYLPPADPAAGKPVLGGGEFVAAFNDKAETQAVQLYLQDVNWVNEKAKIGEWITPHKGLKIENVVSATGEPNPVNQLSVEILQDQNAVFRFDASDLMPAAVGAGTFWKGMMDWITGKDTKTVTDTIEASWPKS